MDFKSLNDFIKRVNSPENIAQTSASVGAAAGAVEVIREVVNNSLDDASGFLFKVQENLEAKRAEATEATVAEEKPDWSKAQDIFTQWSKDASDRFDDIRKRANSRLRGENPDEGDPVKGEKMNHEHDANLHFTDAQKGSDGPVEGKPSTTKEKYDWLIENTGNQIWPEKELSMFFGADAETNREITLRAVEMIKPGITDRMFDRYYKG